MKNNLGLEPCPFCGEKEDISVLCRMYHGGAISIKGMKFWRVECMPCDARTGCNFDGDQTDTKFIDGKEAAIYMWNLRDGKDKP